MYKKTIQHNFRYENTGIIYQMLISDITVTFAGYFYQIFFFSLRNRCRSEELEYDFFFFVSAASISYVKTKE